MTDSPSKKRKADEIIPAGVADDDRELIDECYKRRSVDITELKAKRVELVWMAEALARDAETKLKNLNEKLTALTKSDRDIQRAVGTVINAWDTTNILSPAVSERLAIRKRFVLTAFYGNKPPVSLDDTSDFAPFTLDIDGGATTTITPAVLAEIRANEAADLECHQRYKHAAQTRNYAREKLAPLNRSATPYHGKRLQDSHQWLDDMQRHMHTIESAQREVNRQILALKSHAI